MNGPCMSFICVRLRVWQEVGLAALAAIFTRVQSLTLHVEIASYRHISFSNLSSFHRNLVLE